MSYAIVVSYPPPGGSTSVVVDKTYLVLGAMVLQIVSDIHECRCENNTAHGVTPAAIKYQREKKKKREKRKHPKDNR